MRTPAVAELRPPSSLRNKTNTTLKIPIRLRQDGVLSYAAPLESQGKVVSDKGVTDAPSEPTVAAILIVKAANADAALALVKAHPGIAYGTAIEVRPLKAAANP